MCTADRTITCATDGEAGSAFAHHRIGLCVLHPGQASAGRRYAGGGPYGPGAGVPPELITPQRAVDGTLRGIFEPVDALAVEYAAGRWVRFAFAGDAFANAGRAATPAALLSAARRAFPRVPVGGGTELDFAELNRAPPPPEALDVLAYAVCPQVHATDERPIVETLEAQPVTVATARTLAGSISLAADDLLAAGAGGAPTPAFELLRALSGRTGEPLRVATTDPPLEVAALAVGDLLLMASLRPAAQEVRLEPPGAEPRVLALGPYATAALTVAAAPAPGA